MIYADKINNNIQSILIKSYFIINICVISVPFFAQNTKIDSLKTLLKKDKEDTTKVKHLNSIGWELMYNNPDTCIILGKQALFFAEKSGWKKGITNSLSNLGVYNAIKGDYPQAINYFLKALKIDEELLEQSKRKGNNDEIVYNKKGIAARLANIGLTCYNMGDYPKSLDYSFKGLKINEELNDKKGIGKCLSNIGNVYKDQGLYPKALETYLKSLQIAEALGDKSGIATRLGNIGIIYVAQADYPKALDYYFKALKLDEELGNKTGVARHLGNIGIVYRNIINYPKALEYYLKALKIKEELGNKTEIASTLANIGIVYDDQAEDTPDPSYREELNAKALDYYFKASKMAEELGYKVLQANTLGNIGSLFIETKKYNYAYTYLYRALAISDSIEANDNVKSWYELLSSLYEKSNVPLPDTVGGKLLNMEQMRLRALYYHKRYISIRDTLFSEENKKQLIRKEMNFEFEKKEATAKAEQEKQSAVAAAESRRQRIVLALVSCFLLLVVVLAGFIFRALRITRRQKSIIEKQKHLVEEKQKEILDSIYYARRIQRSLLTSEKYIERNLNKLRKSGE